MRNSCLKDKQLINSTIVRSLNDSEKGFIVSSQRLQTLGCFLSHCHLHEQIFDQKGYSSGSTVPILAWSESVWLLSFPKTQIPPQRSSFMDLWTTSKRSWQTSWGHFHMKTSTTATGSWSNVSSGVWLPKGTTLKGIMLICSSVVNKKFYSTSLITF